MRGVMFVVALLLLALASQGTARILGVTWIHQIYNDASQKVYIKTSSHHNQGELTEWPPQHTFTLNNNHWKVLSPMTEYHVSHCGIPWTPSGLYFSFDRGATGGLMINTKGPNIEYYDLSTRPPKVVRRQHVSHHQYIVSVVITKESNGKIRLSIN